MFGRKGIKRMLLRSKWVHHYQRGSDVVLFHALTGEALFGSSALLCLFHSFPGQDVLSQGHPGFKRGESDAVVGRLCSKKMLVLSPSEDDGMADSLLEKADGFFKGRNRLSLLSTDACNLRCRYCYVRNKDHSPTLMTVDTARRTVDYFFRLTGRQGDERELHFHGGEPLLNLPAVFAAADRALELQGEEFSAGLSLSLTTNGVLLDEEAARQFAKRGVRISVSLDGPPDVHDVYRRSKEGQGSCEQARRAIELLRAEGVDVQIACTLTPEVLSSWDRVVSYFVDEVGVDSVIIGTLLLSSSGEKGMSSEMSEGRSAGAAIRSVIGAAEKNRFEDIDILPRIRAFSKKRVYLKSCAATGGQMAVDPAGNIGPCHGLLGESRYFPRNVFRDYDEDIGANEMFVEWSRRSPLRFPVCRRCPAIGICGGGCPASALRDSGDIWAVDRRTCWLVKPLHEWLMWRVFDQDERRSEGDVRLGRK